MNFKNTLRSNIFVFFPYLDSSSIPHVCRSNVADILGSNRRKRGDGAGAIFRFVPRRGNRTEFRYKKGTWQYTFILFNQETGIKFLARTPVLLTYLRGNATCIQKAVLNKTLIYISDVTRHIQNFFFLEGKRTSIEFVHLIPLHSVICVRSTWASGTRSRNISPSSNSAGNA